MENQEKEFRLNITRKHFLTSAGLGIGSAALGSMLFKDQLFSSDQQSAIPLGLAQFAPKAKRIIYLFQNGAPSQLETFDYKPLLNKMHGEELPASIRKGQRLTGMTANQEKFPLVGSSFGFSQHGQSGAWVSELFPNMASVVDDLCIISN